MENGKEYGKKHSGIEDHFRLNLMFHWVIQFSLEEMCMGNGVSDIPINSIK